MDDNKAKEPPGERGRIMDRRIEASGLSTFASNLSSPQRTSPQPPSPAASFQAHRPLRQRGISCTTTTTTTTPAGSRAPSSVRAIVDWLESTKATPQEPPPKSGDSFDGGHPHPPRRPASPQQAPSSPAAPPPRTAPPPPLSPPPAASAVGASTEAYSLTLLKYKAYFNNRPLGRCLDDGLDTSALPSDLRIALKPGAEAEIVAKDNKRVEEEEEKEEDDGNEPDKGAARRMDDAQPHDDITPESPEAPRCPQRAHEDSDGDDDSKRAPSPRHSKSGSVHRLEELMQELAELTAGSSPSPSLLPPRRIEDNPPTRTPPRPPREARAFWDGIRRYLYIADDDLDGPPPPLPPSVSLSTTPVSAAVTTTASETEAFPTLPLPLTLVDARLGAYQQEGSGGGGAFFSQGHTPRKASASSASAGRSVSRPHQPSTASQSTSAGGGGGHLRRLTTEEKMSEIDAFLDEKSPTLALLNGDDHSGGGDEKGGTKG